MITVERKYAPAFERYLKNTFKLPCEASIQLIVFQEEEEPANVLRALDKANLIQFDLVVIEGNTLLDVPIDEVLDTHKLNKGFITCLLKETTIGKK